MVATKLHELAVRFEVAVLIAAFGTGSDRPELSVPRAMRTVTKGTG
ncbi:hypothetical protein [Streptomyces sp. NPDC047841]